MTEQYCTGQPGCRRRRPVSQMPTEMVLPLDSLICSQGIQHLIRSSAQYSTAHGRDLYARVSQRRLFQLCSARPARRPP